MLLSYPVSVVLISLALYGLYCLIRELWLWAVMQQLAQGVSVSFLVVTRDAEQQVESLLRELVQKVEMADADCDIVILDRQSRDLTPAILDRLADQNPMLRVVHASDTVLSVAEALPLCRGDVVHILDIGSRLTAERFAGVTGSLLRQYEGGRAGRWGEY